MADIQQSLLTSTALATSKIQALMAELNAVRRIEPAVKVIVYTQYEAMQSAIVERLHQEGYCVYNLSSGTAETRHEMASKFQSSSSNNDKARVAVILFKTNGDATCISLSSATRIYMLEPCLDPALESRAKRAAKQDALVKRFVFRYSTESNIIELHKQIASGRIALAGNDKSFLPREAIKILFKGVASSRGGTTDDADSRLLEV